MVFGSLLPDPNISTFLQVDFTPIHNSVLKATLAAFIAVCGAKRLDLQGSYINTYNRRTLPLKRSTQKGYLPGARENSELKSEKSVIQENLAFCIKGYILHRYTIYYQYFNIQLNYRAIFDQDNSYSKFSSSLLNIKCQWVFCDHFLY